MGHEIYLVPTAKPGRLRFQSYQVPEKGLLGGHFSGLIPAPHLSTQEPGVGMGETHTRNGGSRTSLHSERWVTPSPVPIPHWVPKTLELIRHPQPETIDYFGRYRTAPEKRSLGADMWRISIQLPFSQLSPLPQKCTPQPGSRGPERDHQPLLGQCRSQHLLSALCVP